MSNKPITNENGKVIGWKKDDARGDSTYLSATGAVVARVRNGTTLDKTGAVKGKGDQGLRLF